MDLSPGEPVPGSSSASPISELTSSDSETCNTSSARVYFGPLQSPEKKYISLHDVPNPPGTPVIHISLPQSPTQNLPNDNDSDAEDDNAGYLRAGTPDNDPFPPDEPSSALASRIIRAHDNPSPPPSALNHNKNITFSVGVADMRLIDPSPLSSPSPPSIPHRDGSSDSAQSPPFNQRPTSPRTPTRNTTSTPGVASPPDLISFDSFLGPSTSELIDSEPLLVNGQSTSTQRSNANIFPATIDDLLLRSPTPPRRSPRLTTLKLASISPLKITKSPLHRVDTRVPQEEELLTEERVVANSLSVDEDQSPTPSPQKESVAVYCLPSIDNMDISQPLRDNGNAPTTPFRVSTPPHDVSHSSSQPNGIAIFGVPSMDYTMQTPLPRRPQDAFGPPSSAQAEKRRNEKKRSDDSINNIARVLSSRSGGTSEETGARDAPMEFVEETVGKEGKESPKAKGKRRDDGGHESGRRGDDEVYLRGQMGSLSVNIPPRSVSENMPQHTEIKVGLGAIPPTNDDALQIQLIPTPSTPPSRPEEAPVFSTPDHSNSTIPSVPPGQYVAQRSPPRRPTGPDSLNWTPARRIPIELAVQQKQISPEKAAQFGVRSTRGTGTIGGPNFIRTPVFTIKPSTDSPARRVPLTPGGTQTTSPAKTTSRQRSLEPPTQLKFSFDFRQKPSSTLPRGDDASPVKPPPSASWPSTNPFLPEPAHPSYDIPKSVPKKADPPGSHGSTVAGESDDLPTQPPSLLSSRPPAGAALPFPLRPAQDTSKPIAEEGVDASGTQCHAAAADGPKPSPKNSMLRQKSTGSRIPRMGFKPYARPATVSASTSKKATQGKVPVTMRKVGLAPYIDVAKPVKPFRMVPMTNGSGSGSSSDDSSGKSQPPAPTSSLVYGSALRQAKSAETAANLKRKREADQNPKSHLTSRQVGTSYPPKSTTTSGSPVKKPHPLFGMRRVVDRNLNDVKDKSVSRELSHEARTVMDSNGIERRQAEDEERASIDQSKAKNADIMPLDSQPLPDTSSRTFKRRLLNEVKSESPLLPNDNEETSKIRRTPRSRRTLQPIPGTDVFGPVEPRPFQTRRKPPTSSTLRADADVFSGMGVVALKSLTTSNTAKNQKYVAAKLETEIIRKEGARPDSPTVKMKTILQRKEEERDRQRLERAERRARRSDDGLSFLEQAEGQSDRCDSRTGSTSGYCISPERDVDKKGTQKHRRGPGDEEDYETPERPEPPSKRTKVGESDDAVVKKQVKWDRGLYTTIFLEEIHPRTRHRPNENLVTKGCLAKSAKSLRLDILGNLPNAETPLTDIVHENIVVKRYIYDNDLVPLALHKNTRSKGKKGKT